MEYCVDEHGDTTITMREIKIKNIDQWDKLKKADVTESEMAVPVVDIAPKPVDKS